MSNFEAVLSGVAQHIGVLASRGAFDQYATYRPGHIVVDGGVVYLNIAPVGAAPELEDTFGRGDQSGWGQSSHGEVWQTSQVLSNDGPPRISALRGVMTAHGGGSNDDGQMLGPSRFRVDCEVLARFAVTAPPSVGLTVLVRLNQTEDDLSYAGIELAVADDGTTLLEVDTVADPNAGETGTQEAGPTLVAGTDLWLRVRRVGLVYSATVWLTGAPEPGTPQATLTATHAQPAGHPSVLLGAGGDGDALSLGYVSLRHLSAAAAPSGDTDHWVALADALQVPQPL